MPKIKTTKKAPDPNKVNLFDALRNMSSGNPAFFNNLTDAQVKGLSPFVLMLWAKGADSNHDYHVMLTNEFVNPYAFSLSRHPRLLYRLLCAANGGYGSARYSFVPKKTAAKNKALNLIMARYNYSPAQARLVLPLFSEDDLKQLADELGEE